MTDFLTDLTSAIVGDLPDTDSEEVRAPLDSVEATAWMANVENIRRQKDEINEARAEMIRRINETTNARLANLDEQEEWFLEALAMFHQVKLAENPDANKTLVLPMGSMPSRKLPDRWVFDDATFDAWAIENLPGAVEYPPPKVKHQDAKKLLKDGRISDGRVILADGTAVPGLEIVTGERKFDVVTNYDADKKRAGK